MNSVPGRPRQEECEFKASLGSRRRPYLKTTATTTTKQLEKRGKKELRFR